MKFYRLSSDDLYLVWIFIRDVCGYNMKDGITEYFLVLKCNNNIGDFGNYNISK